MLKASITLRKLHDHDTGTATFHVEAKQGDEWRRLQTTEIPLPTPDAVREFTIEDGQRVVIEAVVASSLYYDRDQSALLSRVPSPEAQRLSQDRVTTYPQPEDVTVTHTEPVSPESLTTEPQGPQPAPGLSSQPSMQDPVREPTGPDEHGVPPAAKPSAPDTAPASAPESHKLSPETQRLMNQRSTGL